MGRVSPGRTMNLSLVKMAKAFALVLGVKNSVLDQFMQSILQRVLSDPVNTVSLIILVDAKTLEKPKLVSEAVL
jgi:hypothetical protein